MTHGDEEHVVDRAGWPPGPWDNEPDKVQWTDAATGLPCLIVRNDTGGLCGYVGVAEEHPYFGVDKNDLDLGVHGGLTYSGLCQGHICHVPAPGASDRVWWLGFDCAHWSDTVPGMIQYGMRGTYRDLKYVKDECHDLAAQLKDVHS